MSLRSSDQAVAQGDFRIQSGHYALCGEGLAIGYDSGDAVSSDYTPRFEFSGGRIVQVVYDVADDIYLDAERQMAAALAPEPTKFASWKDVVPGGKAAIQRGRELLASRRCASCHQIESITAGAAPSLRRPDVNWNNACTSSSAAAGSPR